MCLHAKPDHQRHRSYYRGRVPRLLLTYLLRVSNRGDFEFHATNTSLPAASTCFPHPLWKSDEDGWKCGGVGVEVQLISRGVKRERDRLVGDPRGDGERYREEGNQGFARGAGASQGL